MASSTINVRLVTRNDLSVNWESANPVLLKGEMGYATDTLVLKIGDGETRWNDLAPFNCGGSPAEQNFAAHYEGIAEEGESDAEAISRILGENVAHQDDTCTVKHLIYDDKYSYTAYVFDGENWAAFDGNYAPENVYFNKDLVATENIGVIKIGDSGSATIPAAGKNLKQVLDSILAEEKNPTVVAPSVTVDRGIIASYEVGANFTPNYQCTFKAGSYEFGPATGVSVSEYAVSENVTPASARAEAQAPRTTAVGMFPSIQVVDGFVYKFDVAADYTEGAMPLTNLGNDCAEKQIVEGTATATSSTIVGYRQYFYGMSDNTDELDSAAIRALSHKSTKAYTAGTTLTLNANEKAGAVRAILAIPANQITSTRKGLTKVTMPSAMDAETTGTWVLQEDTVDVEGLNGYEAIPYKVWIYQPASLDSTEQYKITLA